MRSIDPNRIRNGSPERIPETDSHERTNERTNGEADYGCLSGNGSRRERVYERLTREPQSVSEAMDGFLDILEMVTTDVRWPVVRSGEREPIPQHVRAAVWYRDGGKCNECLPEYPYSSTLHLDHIKPWSAGGEDTSDNLRLLCDYHNLQRSNFVDFAEPKRPVTWWCINCFSDSSAWVYYTNGGVKCPRHGKGGSRWCRVARSYERQFQQTGELPTWHRRSPMATFLTMAYCAHCDRLGLTGAPL